MCRSACSNDQIAIVGCEGPGRTCQRRIVHLVYFSSIHCANEMLVEIKGVVPVERSLLLSYCLIEVPTPMPPAGIRVVAPCGVRCRKLQNKKFVPIFLIRP